MVPELAWYCCTCKGKPYAPKAGTSCLGEACAAGYPRWGSPLVGKRLMQFAISVSASAHVGCPSKPLPGAPPAAGLALFNKASSSEDSRSSTTETIDKPPYLKSRPCCHPCSSKNC